MKFGLKFKILLGITVLLAICTAFSLGYSYKLFVDDKTSYVYESGLKKAENISDQINFKIEDLKNRLEYNTLLINNNSVNFEKIVNSQNDLVLIGALEITGSKVAPLKQYSNTKNISAISNNLGINTNDFLKEVSLKAIDPSFLTNDRIWIFSPKPNARFLIHFSKRIQNTLYFAVADLNPIFEIFSKDNTYKNKIVPLSDETDKETNRQWLSGLDYSKSKKGVFTKELSGQHFLTAYVFVSDKILVLSSIDKDAAFGITKFLILKTTLFAIFLLGIAAIGGIYFSSSITFPIKTLTNAAEKVASGDFSSKASIKTSDEIKILGDTFDFMSSEIQGLLKNKEELISKLEDYSRNLEDMVAQRTKELKEANDFMALMVNSLDQGLLVFDNELKCHPMFTKACEPIFGVSPLDKTLTDVLNITNEDNVQSLKQWAMVTFNEMIPFESAINLGPRNKVTGNNHNDENYKFVQLDYYPMRDAEDKIINVVLIATDKTNEVQATEKAKEKESYVTMILKILNNKTQFESFINEVEEIFEQFPNAYSLEKNSIEFDLCMMLFHTLNGGFGIYSISKLQLMAREYETELSNLKENCPDPSEYIPFLQIHIQSLRDEFLNFRKELDSLIGTKFASNISIAEIPRSKILNLKAMVEETKNAALYHYYVDNFVKTPVINYFKAYDDLCKTTAVKIGKEFNGLSFHNENLEIEPEPFLEFFNVLVHLFRNCLDHGLEESYTRQNLGKTPDGHIEVAFDEIYINMKKYLSVRVQDDGAGIDPNKIRERFIKLNPDEDISDLSDEEIIYKIFDPFFSTRDEVSALSGRGVGMSAIKEVVDRLHGQIEIISTVGTGTLFSFMLPLDPT